MAGSALFERVIAVLSTVSEWTLLSAAEEQRSSPRVEIAFPTLVRGKRNQVFEEQTITHNLSATGLYLHLKQPVDLGSHIFVVVYLSTNSLYRVSAPRVALRGVVIRAEPRTADQYGIAVRLTNYRFLTANDQWPLSAAQGALSNNGRGRQRFQAYEAKGCRFPA